MFRLFDLTGKKAFVTGSSQGIGKAIALLLAEAGALVFVHDLSNMEACEKVVREITDKGCVADAVVGNLLDNSFLNTISDTTGQIDILIINASMQIKQDWRITTEEEFFEQLRVNMYATSELIKTYEKGMRKNSFGRIVTIGSVQQSKPHEEMVVYAASKAGVMNMVMNLAKQMAPFGITVNNVSPGVIDTPRNDAALKDMTYHKKLLQKIPAGRIGKPEDCSTAVLMLCSESGGYITGIDLVIDGGMHL